MHIHINIQITMKMKIIRKTNIHMQISIPNNITTMMHIIKKR